MEKNASELQHWVTQMQHKPSSKPLNKNRLFFVLKLVNVNPSAKMTVGAEQKGHMASGRCVTACMRMWVTFKVKQRHQKERLDKTEKHTEAKLCGFWLQHPSDWRASMTLNSQGSVSTELEGKTRRHFEKRIRLSCSATRLNPNRAQAPLCRDTS